MNQSHKQGNKSKEDAKQKFHEKLKTFSKINFLNKAISPSAKDTEIVDQNYYHRDGTGQRQEQNWNGTGISIVTKKN